MSDSEFGRGSPKAMMDKFFIPTSILSILCEKVSLYTYLVEKILNMYNSQAQKDTTTGCNENKQKKSTFFKMSHGEWTGLKNYQTFNKKYPKKNVRYMGTSS
jgi:hypothetical protein